MKGRLFSYSLLATSKSSASDVLRSGLGLLGARVNVPPTN